MPWLLLSHLVHSVSVYPFPRCGYRCVCPSVPQSPVPRDRDNRKQFLELRQTESERSHLFGALRGPLATEFNVYPSAALPGFLLSGAGMGGARPSFPHSESPTAVDVERLFVFISLACESLCQST